MLLRVLLSRYFVLPLGIAHYFLVFQHQSLLPLPVLILYQLIMRGRTPESTFLGAIGSVGIFAVFKVEANLVEALLGDKIFAFRTKVAAIDDGINEFIRTGP